MNNIESVTHVTSFKDAREIYGPPNSIVLAKVISRFDKFTTGFLQASRFMAAHFRDEHGDPVPLIVGGTKGFAQVIDSQTVIVDFDEKLWPEDRLRISANSGYPTGLLFVVPGIKETLRMKGRAVVARAPAPSTGKLRMTMWIDNTFFHCAKAFIRSRVWEPAPLTTRWKGLRDFKCIRKVQESSVITSFYFAPVDGGTLPDFSPGQHIPIEISLPGEHEPERRAYSLSNRPGDPEIRISIKRELPPARVSNHFHDQVDVDSVVRMRAPAGQFVLNEASARPVVLLSAGVGLTPMISMLEHLVATKSDRTIWYFHGARSGREHAMGERVRRIAREHRNVRVHVCYGCPGADDHLGTHFESQGRLSIDVLKATLPWNDYEFYLCGPASFMKTMAEGLMDNGVRPDRIRWEAFSAEKPDIAMPSILPSEPNALPQDPVRVAANSIVEFRRSGKTVNWTETSKSLLDLAEANGIAVRSACRTGECFTCSTRILAGAVSYPNSLGEIPDDDSALICSAVPDGRVALDL